MYAVHLHAIALWDPSDPELFFWICPLSLHDLVTRGGTLTPCSRGLPQCNLLVNVLGEEGRDEGVRSAFYTYLRCGRTKIPSCFFRFALCLFTI